MTCYRIAIVSLLAAAALIAHAQEVAPLSGKYSGHYETKTRTGNSVSVGVELTILQTEGTNVTATLIRHAGKNPCRGEYPMAGTMKGDTLTLRSTAKSGAADDCSFKLSVKQQGNKLVGTALGDRPLELSK